MPPTGLPTKREDIFLAKTILVTAIYPVLFTFTVPGGDCIGMRGLARIIGQNQVVGRLREFAGHFLRQGSAPDHILLVGAEGMGKRVFAEAFAEELGMKISVSRAPLLEKRGDVTAILTSLDLGDVFFLEDIQRLRQPLKEILVSALREFRIDLIVGKGAGARVHPFQLNRFTRVSSVQREGDVTPDLRDSISPRPQFAALR